MSKNLPIEPRPLTLGQLAVELAADRRTIRKALRDNGAEPVLDTNGHPTWTVPQALDAMSARARQLPHERRLARFQRAPAPPPPWLEAITAGTRTDFERGFAIAVASAVYQVPQLAAAIAPQVEPKPSMAQVYEYSKLLTVALFVQLSTAGRDLRLAPFTAGGDDGPACIDLGAFVPMNWRYVARELGEPDWVPPAFGFGWSDLDADGQLVEPGEEGDEDDADDDA
jgi:hypothetical protein